jgi:hypothetical protein
MGGAFGLRALLVEDEFSKGVCVLLKYLLASLILGRFLPLFIWMFFSQEMHPRSTSIRDVGHATSHSDGLDHGASHNDNDGHSVRT